LEDQNIQPKIKEIAIANKRPKARGVFCETAIYYPENIEEAKLGCLFILGRLKSANSEPSHVLNLLAASIKKEYYSNPKRGPAKSMEEALKKANGVLIDLAKNGKVDWLEKFNFICAALAKNNLYLTNIGQTKILLMRDGRIADIGKKLIPIQDKINPQKAFQSVASGKIYLNDKIALTTADIFKFIPQKGFRQLLERGQIEEMEKLLNEDEDFSTHGMFLVELAPEEKIQIKKHEKITLSPVPAPSAAKPLPTKEKIRSALAEKFESFYSEAAFLAKNYYFKLKDRIKMARKESRLKKTAYSPPEPVGKKTASGTPAAPMLIERKIKPPAKIIDAKMLLAGFRQKFSLFSSAKATPIPSLASMNRKKLFFAVLILAIIIAGFGIFMDLKYRNDAKEASAAIAREEEKINQARKIISLENPEVFTDFNNRESEPKRIILIKDNILTLGSNSGYFYLTPLAEPQNIKAIPAGLPSVSWKNAATLDGENILILQDEESNLLQYNISQQETAPISVQSTGLPVKIKDFELYNKTLYLLEENSGQIFKCSELSACSKWNRGELTSSSLSLAIDGSVYTINSDKILDKYYSGAKEKSYFIKLSSKLNDIKIKTAKDFKNIYLADRQNNRLVVISKNGELLRQYASESFINLKDFQISDDEKTAYVLDGNKIFSISME
jgi:hypothetical protein